MGKKIYSFLDDFVFKVIFGREGNERLLMTLLNAVLRFEKGRRIVSLQLLNPFHPKEIVEAKTTVVDVKAVDADGRRFTVEVQVQAEAGFVSRAVFYLAKLFVEQLREGEPFEELRQSYGVAILDFILFPRSPSLQSVYRFRGIEPEDCLPETMEQHFIELPKIEEMPPYRLRTRFEKWLHLLRFGVRYGSGTRPPPQFRSDMEIMMAIDELKKVNADRLTRQLLELRSKSRHDEATKLSSARRKGRQEGREDVARAMLAEGSEIDFIAKVTGLSREEIERLRA